MSHGSPNEPISINYLTRVIFVPKSYLNVVDHAMEQYELDVDQFRLDLKDLEDDIAGMSFPDTHRHNTEVVLGDLTLARVVEIINNYKVEFENGIYAVSLTGANNNILDVVVLNSVSLRSNNSAGLIVRTEAGGGGDSAAAIVAALMDEETETGLTFRQALRLYTAVLGAISSGQGSGTIRFKDFNNTKDRVVTFNVDRVGNRPGPIIYDLD